MLLDTFPIVALSVATILNTVTIFIVVRGRNQLPK